MTASSFLQRKRSHLAAWIRVLALFYAIPALVAPYLFEAGRGLGFIRSTFQGYGQPPRDQHHGTIAQYTGIALAVLLVVFAKRIAAFFLPGYAPPFPLRADAATPDIAENQTLWIRLLTDARRPWRLLLFGSVLLALAVEPGLIIVVILLDPLMYGPPVTTSPLTVSYAYGLLLPGALAVIWGGLLWWDAYSDRRDLRRQMRMRS